MSSQPASSATLSPPASPAPGRSSVPLAAKLAYGAAGPVDIWATWVPKSMANQVFNMTLLVSPSLISLAFLIFRLWDAITDPVMGWISDNHRGRFGRRRPFIVIGAVLLALTFPLIWQVDRSWSQPRLAAWLIGSGLVFYSCYTIWAMPYQSLLLEMSPDTHERTRITAIRALFQKFAGIIGGWVWAIASLDVFADPSTGQPDLLAGIQAVSVALAALMLVIGLLPAFVVKERFAATLASRPKVRLRDSLRQTAANPSFRLIGVITLLFAIGTNMIAGFGAYLTNYYVFGGNMASAAALTGVTNMVSLGVGIASLPLFDRLSRRHGKMRTLYASMAVLLLGNILTWWSFDPDHPWLLVINGLFIAPGNTGLWMMIPSMIADITDEDELHTGQRREGSYAAVYAWIFKVATALAFGLSGPVLELTGFRAELGADQAPGVLTTMRLLMVLVPVASLLGAMSLTRRYTLDATRMAAIRAELEARRGVV